MRQLATVQRILDLQPIPSADNIELAQVLGWKVVVKKGEFQIGDLCVYAEVDSVFPEKPEFEFLRPKHFRIRTIKLKGQISQGIAFPLSIIPTPIEVTEGCDVTDLLGIVKYEPPVDGSLRGQGRGTFPGFIRKTDEERIQTCKHILHDYISTSGQWYVSEKLDGSSFSAYHKTVLDGTVDIGVCSRNTNLKIGTGENDDNRFVQAFRTYELNERLRSLGRDLCIQGEILGPGIQKNKYCFSKHVIRFFSVFDIKAFSYVSFNEFIDTIGELGLETVPILDKDFSLLPTVDQMVEYATAKSVVLPSIWREGVVIRKKEDCNVSFKVINPQFLLKYDDA